MSVSGLIATVFNESQSYVFTWTWHHFANCGVVHFLSWSFSYFNKTVCIFTVFLQHS